MAPEMVSIPAGPTFITAIIVKVLKRLLIKRIGVPEKF
jgi:hypothetical protein